MTLILLNLILVKVHFYDIWSFVFEYLYYFGFYFLVKLVDIPNDIYGFLSSMTLSTCPLCFFLEKKIRNWFYFYGNSLEIWDAIKMYLYLSFVWCGWQLYQVVNCFVSLFYFSLDEIEIFVFDCILKRNSILYYVWFVF